MKTHLVIQKTDRLVNCADSRPLEVFVGAWLASEAWERIPSTPWVAFVIACVGVLTAAAALRGDLALRKWACGYAVFAAAFLAPGHGAILVALAASWAWYRTILDDKVSP